MAPRCISSPQHPQQRHIIEMMDEFQTSQQSAIPLPHDDQPHPIPQSAFANFHPKLSTRGRCSHITMARSYHLGYRCDRCRSLGSFGWLYRCTQDTDILIQKAHSRGLKITFDDIGEMFSEQMSLGSRGPDARSNKLNFFKEVTAEEIRHYQPDQIATILVQRKNVHKSIAQDRESIETAPREWHENLHALQGKPTWPSKQGGECQHKVCHTCHMNGRDKSWLSLDGIANGEIPPTAATGFSFIHLKARPVIDLEVVKNIGLRAVPLRRSRPLPPIVSPSSSFSTYSETGDVDEYGEDAVTVNDAEDSTSPNSAASFDDNQHNLKGPDEISGHLKAKFSISEAEISSRISAGAMNREDLLVRPPWTPPPTPTSKFIEEMVDIGKTVGVSANETGYNGRSPTSLKSNPNIRKKVFSSIPLGSSQHDTGSTDVNDVWANPLQIPYQVEELYDVGLLLRFNQEVFDKACSTMLPAPTLEEELYLAGIRSVVGDGSYADTVNAGEPVEVSGGFALTEEGVETVTPDVIASL